MSNPFHRSTVTLHLAGRARRLVLLTEKEGEREKEGQKEGGNDEQVVRLRESEMRGEAERTI